MAVSLLVQVADSMSLTLDQMREGARLVADHTAEQDYHTLTAEITVTLGQYRQAVHGEPTSTPAAEHQVNNNAPLASAADEYLLEAMAHIEGMSM